MIVRSELLGPGKVEVVVALTPLLLLGSLTFLHPQTGAFDRIISCIEISKIAVYLHTPSVLDEHKRRKAPTCPGRPLPLLHPSSLFKLLIDVLLLCRC